MKLSQTKIIQSHPKRLVKLKLESRRRPTIPYAVFIFWCVNIRFGDSSHVKMNLPLLLGWIPCGLCVYSRCEDEALSSDVSVQGPEHFWLYVSSNNNEARTSLPASEMKMLYFTAMSLENYISLELILKTVMSVLKCGWLQICKTHRKFFRNVLSL